MSERIKNSETKRSSPLIATGLAFLALAGSAGIAKGTTAEAFESRESSKKSPEKAKFQRTMNNRVRNTVVNFASHLNKGPSKPDTLLESQVGPIRINTISYGSPDRSGREYTVTTMAPYLPGGKTDVRKTSFIEINAGDTRLTFSQDPISKDWSIDGAYPLNKDGSLNSIRAAVDPVTQGDAPLGPERLNSFRTQFGNVLADGQNLVPFRNYKPAFPQPRNNQVEPLGN